MIRSISLAEARAIALRAQGIGSHPFGSGKNAVLRALEYLGYVQIDTISVVERAHHHVLWSRVPDYRPGWLGELQTAGKVFEYWSHAASFLPMQEYRYAVPQMRLYREGKRHWFRRDRKVMNSVLERIRSEGPLQASDFEAPRGHRSGTWFTWKPAKRALENLVMLGELMVRERKGFQKVFDLPERVIPSSVDTREPSPDEHGRFLVLRALRSHGVVREQEIAYHYPVVVRKNALRALEQMVETGEVLRLGVDRRRDGKIEVLALPLELERAINHSAKASILSPFDSVTIQRARLRWLFDFDYMIECYTPGPKRRFGYFSLPIAWRNRLVGRLDAKADRETATLVVRSLHLEKSGLKVTERDAFFESLAVEIEAFARFNGCTRTQFLPEVASLGLGAGVFLYK